MPQWKVAVVGATGIAGQQYVAALQNHPWFQITKLAASERSAGKSYADALTDASTGARRWWVTEGPDERLLKMPVENARDLDASQVDIVFTAIESDAAKELEPYYARTTPVFSTASAYRQAEDVPLMIAGVNLDHAELVRRQQEGRGWKGFIVPIPNCTVTGFAVTLKPLADAFGVKRVVMTSMQGLSGAGRSPGVLGLDVIDNVIPFIPGEEEKVESEAQKILGRYTGSGIERLDLPVSATCTRVPVIEGHTEAVFVELSRDFTVDEARRVLRDFGRAYVEMGLPSAPERLIEVLDDPFRPQPRLDRDRGRGMTTTVGRLRRDHTVEQGLKYVLVTHNTKLGAAKGAVALAEYMASRQFF